MLGILSTQPVKRDFALLNRCDDLLTDSLASRYGIPAEWWRSPGNGLEAQGTVYRQRGW